MFECTHLDFFMNDNVYTGSQDGLRFRVAPEGETLRLWTWMTDICFEKAEPGEPQEFPLTDEGLSALLACLEQRHAAIKE